jgi:4-amino-4-deoxy-L-arabinose transferase-like glycosyltransferase
MAFAAALLNVVAGTISIAATARLAKAWIGQSAAVPAAWLMAIAGGQIYFTASFVTETLYIAVSLTALVLLTEAIDARASAKRMVLVGVVVGYAILVRTPGMVLLVAPALILRGRYGSWRGTARATAAVALGAAVLLVPWAVRNGVQVGVWTPGSTNNAVVICIGHRDGADGVNTETIELYRDCYVHSPYDNPALIEPGETPAGFRLTFPDEGRWYRTNITKAAKWAVTHPKDEVRLIFWKTYETMSAEPDAVWAARQFTDKAWPSPLAADVLNQEANAWQWVVLSLAALALALLPTCRRAVPLWALPLGYCVLIWGGVAQPQYKLPAMPLVAILAGAATAAVAAQREVAGTGDR